MSMLQVTAPFDGSLIAELPRTTEGEAFDAIERAYALYDDRTAWLSAETRIAILKRLAALIEPRVQELAVAAAREGGKPLVDSLVEVRRAISGIETAIEAIGRLVGQEIPMGQNAASKQHWATTYREPRGVVLSISAFNHPFNLLIHQVVTAVAAGCPVLIKPASATPLSCRSLCELLEQAGLPAGWCQMILPSQEVTTRLAADERVAFLSFIGSHKVGWMLRSRLAAGASCVLEHGGVAPVIVDETADLDDAIPRLTKAAFYHAGQVCVSAQRLYAHLSIADVLAARMADAAKLLRVGDPTLPETEVGPLIRPSEVDRVQEWIDEAVAGGGKLLCGGKKINDFLFEPTIVFNPPDSCRLSTEEVFGPVLAIYSYDDIDAAVRRANLKDAYFQAAYFTNRLDRALRIGRELHGTAVMINEHCAFRVDWMPFGGHRRSGLHLGGIEQTMKDMTLERMIVFRQGP